MDVLIELFLPISIWFQSAPGWINAVAKVFTFLGNTEFYLLIMPALFWSIDTLLGIRIGIMLLISGGLNSLLKFAFQWPRPFWVSDKVSNLVDATGFGFPSGHSQNAASLWGLLAASTAKKWLRWIAGLVIALIGISRIALGVHFTHDVLFGWLVGFLVLVVYLLLEKRVAAWFREHSFPAQFLALVICTSLFILPALALVNPFNPPPLPQAWIDGAGDAINPYSYHDLLTTAGAFFGLGLGLLLLNRLGGFSAEGRVWQRIVRYLVGLVGVLLLYLGLGSIFPDEIDLLSYSLRFLRYTLIGLWISFGAPQVFSWLKLASPKAEPPSSAD
ncbi:MAG: phosphatase PAP2 family protein [Anaerolineales bacterium]